MRSKNVIKIVSKLRIAVQVWTSFSNEEHKRLLYKELGFYSLDHIDVRISLMQARLYFTVLPMDANN